jgi:hypothetical protein
LFRDHLEMPVTLCERALFTTEYPSRARRDHDFNVVAVHGDPGVGWATIICAVSGYPGDWNVNLIQQWPHL